MQKASFDLRVPKLKTFQISPQTISLDEVGGRVRELSKNEFIDC